MLLRVTRRDDCPFLQHIMATKTRVVPACGHPQRLPQHGESCPGPDFPETCPLINLITIYRPAPAKRRAK